MRVVQSVFIRTFFFNRGGLPVEENFNRGGCRLKEHMRPWRVPVEANLTVAGAS